MAVESRWFRLESKLAEGGMGAVYMARHARTGRPLAVKVLKPTPLGDSTESWLMAEVVATARLHHENVIGILDHGVLPEAFDDYPVGTHFFAMEFVGGGSVADAPPTDWQGVCDVLVDCLHALAHAHARDLIHRDIKPANILRHVLADGRIRHVLTDFGIAHAAERQTRSFADDLTGSSHEDAAGTPYYMAPEQFMGLWRNYGPWTDLYALGIVAWELVTGKAPFRASNLVMVGMMHINQPLPELAPKFGVPPGFGRWVERMTAKSTQQRFANAADALDELLALGGPHLSSRDFDSWERVDRRYRVATVVGGGFGLFGVRHVPIEGRWDIRARLWSALQRARGTTCVTVMRGDVGVGKSRLAEWAHHLGREVGAVHSFKVAVGTQFGVAGGLVGLVHQIFRSQGLVGPKLRTRMEEWLTERGNATFDYRLLADFADMSGEGGHVLPEQIFSSLVALLRIVARDRPVQLWLDDLDRGELEMQFVQWLVEEDAPFPMHVVATGVSDFGQQTWLGAPSVEVHDVCALSGDEIERLLHKHVHLPPGVSGKVVDYAAGSPLFALQLLEDWAARGLIVSSDDGRLELVESDDLLPRDIEALWMRRVVSFARHYPPDQASAALRVLQAAAMLGDVVEWRLLEAVAEELGGRVSSTLYQDLLEARLVVPHEVGFSFVHRLLRHTLLSQAQQAPHFEAMHAACARVVGRFYQAHHPDIALRIADHLSHAGQWQAALVAARHAAWNARLSFDIRALERCCAVWERCLDGMGVAAEHARRIDLWTMRSYPYLLDAAPENQRKAFALLDLARQQLDATTRIGHRARFVARAGIAAMYGYREPAEALAEIVEVLAQPGLEDSHRYECEIAAARLSAVMGQTEAMIHHGSMAWGLASSALETMQALQVLARANLERGDLAAATAAIENAAAVALENNLVVAEARCHETAGFIADAAGDFSRAAAHHARACELFELATPRGSYPHVQREYLARALLAAGRAEEAYREFQRVRGAYELGKAGYHTHFHEALLAACLATGRVEEAERWLAPACDFTSTRAHQLHFRGLALAVVHARRLELVDLAEGVWQTLVALVGPDDAARWLASAQETP